VEKPHAEGEPTRNGKDGNARKGAVP